MNVNRLEFFMTKHCTGRCKHCSVDFLLHSEDYPRENRRWREDVIKQMVELSDIESVLLFGGEPLLNNIAVSDVLMTVRDLGIPKRQIMTNAYFCRDLNKMERIVSRVIKAGANSFVLSVDAFHQETIDFKYVVKLLDLLEKYECDEIIIQPCWINNEDFVCFENKKTAQMMSYISENYRAVISPGNRVALEGRAMDHYKHYYDHLDQWESCENIPFMNDLRDVKRLRFMVNGDVTLCKAIKIGNVVTDTMEAMINAYENNAFPEVNILSNEGIKGLEEVLANPFPSIKPRDMSSCEYCYRLVEYSRR